MKVKDIIDSQKDFSCVHGTKVKFIVKAQGTGKHYYNSETHLWRNKPEVAKMEVNEWFIGATKKNYCEFIIIVERDEEYEARKAKAWEDLISR